MYLENQAEAWTLGLIAALAGTLLGLFSLWFSDSDANWRRRVLALGALLAAIFAIPAPELAILVAMQLAVVYSAIRVSRSRASRADDASGTSRRGRLRYSLRTLLVTTFVCALLLAGVRYDPKFMRESALPACVLGVISAMVTLLAQSLWTKPGLRPFRWPIVLLLAAVCGAILDAALPGSIPIGFTFPPDAGEHFTFHFALTAIQGLLIGIIGAMFWKPRATNVGASRSKLPRMLGYALVCLITLALTPIYYFLVRPVPIPPAEIPKPNAWAQLLEITKSLNWKAIPEQDYDVATLKDLRRFSADNSAQLAKGRELVTEPSWVPLTYTEADVNMDDLMLMRTLARALAADVLLSFKTKKYSRAARQAATMMWLAPRASRGGLYLHALVGNAIEGMGAADMRNSISHLDQATRKYLIQELLQLDQTREPFEDIRAREVVWAQRAEGWLGRLAVFINRVTSDQRSGTEPAIRESYLRMQAMTRLLITELALQQFTETNGAPPDRLEQLVPDSLPELPVDAFDLSAKPMRYKRQGKKWKLYSVGPDGVDDSGVMGTVPIPPGTDLFLDSLGTVTPTPATSDRKE